MYYGINSIGSALKKVTATTRRHARAFTMIDLMVSLAIVAILIALMFPAISMVRESTRKVVCGSNLRQIGLGVSLFSQDNRDVLPDSVFLPEWTRHTSTAWTPDRMDTVLLSESDQPGRLHDRWDGMGLLFRDEYISAPNIFYCPSHRGSFSFMEAEQDWSNLEVVDEIIVNYLYRGMGPDNQRVLYNINSTAALVTDTMRSYEDLNHEDGFNVLQAGLAVDWYDDIGGQIANDLLGRDNGTGSNTVVRDAWDRLDEIPGLGD